MSYVPQDDAALSALIGLTEGQLDLPESITGLGEPYRTARMDALRQLLIALVCPAPCVGYVNDTGWHLGCEKRADAALEALHLWQIPGPQLPNQESNDA